MSCPTAPDRVLPGCSVLRFHVDLPSNGWPRHGQVGEVQPHGHRGTDNFEKETLFRNILAILFQRDFWDVAFACVLQLAPGRPVESTVLNLPGSESSPRIDALARFALWYLISCSVSWPNFWVLFFSLEFESSVHGKEETQRKYLRTPKPDSWIYTAFCFIFLIRKIRKSV